MNNKKQNAVDSKATLSRRGVLKTAAATVAGLAVGNAIFATAAVPFPANLDYDNDGLWPENVYPLLAAWLVFTTSQTAVTLDVAGLMNAIGLSNKSATAIAAPFLGSYAQSFINVRKAFHDIAKGFAPSGSPYSGGICPDVLKPLRDIAALYQPHPTKSK